jgi:hypothetical protein
MSRAELRADLGRWGVALRDLLAQLHGGFVLGPLALAIVFSVLAATRRFVPEKASLESLAIWVLAIASGLAVVRLLVSRDVFFAWGAALLLTLFSREVHFVGTDVGVYLGLTLLGFLTLQYYDRLEVYLAQPFVVNAFAMTFLCFVISTTLDQRFWRARSGWPGIPGEQDFHVEVEEIMEVAGHLFASAAVLLARRRRH